MNDERPERESQEPKVVAGIHIGGRDRHSGLTAGLLIIIIGVLLLLDQEGIVPLSHVLRFWPVLLIAWGVGAVVRSQENQGRLWRSRPRAGSILSSRPLRASRRRSTPNAFCAFIALTLSIWSVWPGSSLMARKLTWWSSPLARSSR